MYAMFDLIYEVNSNSCNNQKPPSPLKPQFCLHINKHQRAEAWLNKLIEQLTL